MGIVEVLPGVSAGTIALLTGIYEQLVRSLTQITRLRRGVSDREPFLNAVQFLLPLGCGMAIGFLVALYGVVEFVNSQPQMFWGAVCGLLIGTLVVLATSIAWKQLALFAPLGLIVGLALALIPQSTVEPPLWLFVIGGVGGFCAWLLPGVSGSMVLLLMGLWLPMLEAIRHIEVAKIALFIAGLVLAFSVLPRWIEKALKWNQERVIAIFVGLIASTLYRAWPWQQEQGSPYLPWLEVGDSQVVGVMICFVSAIAIAIGLSRVSTQHE